MSTTTSIASLPTAPFDVHSIHFDFPGGEAIQLREPLGNLVVGRIPEWVANPTRNEIAAYVRATRPQVRVIFRGVPSANGIYTVGADGMPSQVEERTCDLAFDPTSGLSMPILFRLRVPLPDRIGCHDARFDWYVRENSESCIPIRHTLHRVCTTWRAMTPNPPQQLNAWVYDEIMEWTCQWARGCDDEKSICDALLTGLPASRLQYGVNAHDVQSMLLRRGGMCGGWYQMFQQMAHCQGVFVHRRQFLVHWRLLPGGEEHWCALVIRRGGLNQPSPTHPPSDFNDNDVGFPILVPVALTVRNERRYRFWGVAGAWADGHCINFLESAGRLYLYDASFAIGPIEVSTPLPPNNHSIWGGAQLASFKLGYLDAAVDYMLGSLYNGLHGVLLRTLRRGANGMTVKTADIPEVVNGNPGLTFGWGP